MTKFSWKFSGSESAQAKNIPFQLQKLFLMLQTGVKSSLETKELTTSFGWESGDAYDQHDVQELCRIMFDALEHKWRNTENSSIIQDLYKYAFIFFSLFNDYLFRGTIQDYVKCLRCLNERVKEDVFLDLPLAIKPYGKFDSYRSIV
jgi:ubiquitin carboxyl-terminal hydrolase 47